MNITPFEKIIILIIMIILIILSAFFSSCEIAYSSVSRIKLKKQIEKQNRKAINALKVIDNYPSNLATILVGNDLVNILVSSLGTIVAVSLWGEELGPTLSIIIVTIVVLIFGEILPKAIGSKFNYSLSLFYYPILNFFKIIFFPITWGVEKMVKKLSVIWTPKDVAPTATDEELITITEELEEEGVIDEDDAELIKSAIDFCDVTAHEIMKPRVDVFAIDIDDNQDEILSNDEIFKYSRVPVYEDTIDNVIGILNTTDLMKKLLQNEVVNIKEMLIKPYYVHKTKPISDILTEFKETHRHLALVIDEFGGVMGILTIEDIIEELVGDIFDELDEVVLDYEQVSESEYLVDGDMNIYDFFDLVDYDTKDFESEYTTVGGWCTDILEKFPEIGEHFDFANLHIEITEASPRRVEKILVKVTPLPEEENE